MIPRKKRFPIEKQTVAIQKGFGGWLPSVRADRDPLRYENLHTRNALCVVDADPDVLQAERSYPFVWFDGDTTRETRLLKVQKATRGLILIDAVNSKSVSDGRATAHDNLRLQLFELGFADLEVWPLNFYGIPNALANAETLRDALMRPSFALNPAWAAIALKGLKAAGGRARLGELRLLADLGPKPKSVLLALYLDGIIVLDDPAAPLNDASQLNLN